ncbi:thiosulfate sulfurtransferase GlpE [Dysgonomonas sp. Marseille-P4677]|uniref:thiosulfate sulfurtransferase GlpE n=1 Tax=Dysgonomonas sp. Marseille-P4677 TaxID=2364790 RepID=UPI0019147382|nr:thiosulfate sulfurtransferase GlpE [Dysgonomonas sp. Marseille-P4677]MBK5722730.1 thiosulfate sulfurtransferase GlpE [Dysgonomonas sp. Marseille-P4677]
MVFKRISSSRAKELVEKNNDSVLVDIRDTDSFINGHVDGALHLTNESLSGFLSTTSKDSPVLVMCYHGNSSQTVAQFLSEQGFTEVYSIDGGYEEWYD